jgi:squalene-hopene/tetraprenyl-beta-curcumene cyclase
MAALERNQESEVAALDESVDQAALKAYRHLLSLRHPDGHWCGELEGCTILESEYMLLQLFVNKWDENKMRKAAVFIRRQQGDDGGWPIYPGGPADVSTSVKAYFVLKLVGDDADAPHMRRARATILALGGVEAVNSFTKVYLAIFGQYPWQDCPAIPPEMSLLPWWSYFNIYEMSSFSRVMVVPLGIIWSRKPVCPVPAGAGIGELRAVDRRPGTAFSLPTAARAWRSVFLALDRFLKWLENTGVKPLRKRALANAEAWLTERMNETEGLGAIFPPIVNSTIALRCLGHELDHPLIRRQLDALESLVIQDADSLRVQPCKGPVWDTALALSAARAHEDLAGVRGGTESHDRTINWLLEREVRQVGDWAVKNASGRPGGWPFQYINGWNPDCDDTAQVLLAVAGLRSATSPLGQAADRAVAWLVSMQNDDGGFAAFDRNCDKRLLSYVPFADHNAMIDPSCDDITGRVLDALVTLGLPREHPAIQRAVRFLERSQASDGTWFGRWGCNSIYGTYLALTGLAAAGVDLGQLRYVRSAAWLRGKQNPDGGWGETLASYDDPSCRGNGPSTAAQTAWALLALFATGDHQSATVQSGLEHLIRTQEPGGGWRDRPWTGTGFPRVFYLRYALYDRYFPLLALATYRRHNTTRRLG